MLTLGLLLLACSRAPAPDTSDEGSASSTGASEVEDSGGDTATPELSCADGALHCATLSGWMGEEVFSVEVDALDERLEVVEVSCAEGFTLLLDGQEPRVWVELASPTPGPVALGEGVSDEVSWSQTSGAYTQYGTAAFVDTVDFDEVYGTGAGRVQRADTGSGGTVAGWLGVQSAWLKDHRGVRLGDEALTGEVRLRFSAQCP